MAWGYKGRKERERMKRIIKDLFIVLITFVVMFLIFIGVLLMDYPSGATLNIIVAICLFVGMGIAFDGIVEDLRK